MAEQKSQKGADGIVMKRKIYQLLFVEIDFLLQKDKVTSRHNIRPLEVKSGKNYTLSSLKKCMKKFGEYMTTPTVLHADDYKVEDGITYLPLYMTPLL